MDSEKERGARTRIVALFFESFREAFHRKKRRLGKKLKKKEKRERERKKKEGREKEYRPRKHGCVPPNNFVAEFALVH